MSNNAHDLSNRLLNALDNNYNVVDMHTVNEIISILEKINITKELLETTRLGKHVNELRRKTTDPTLARRAKVLVKRWRDLVIPTRASPAHTGSNRSSAERQVRRLGGTPLTSPALSRQVVSPAVPSPRPPSRPAWGGYESDSQDVILVDDDPPPPAAPPPPPLASTAHRKPNTPPIKRPVSPEPVHDEKKSKRDKKPKKRRGHSRAGSGTEATATPPPTVGAVPAVGVGVGTVPPVGAAAAWNSRNGAHEHRERHERRRNGCRDNVDPYAALVNKIPQAGAKKVKTTKELLEQIQSRGTRAAPSPDTDRDDDVVLVEDNDVCPIKANSPLRNGGAEEPTTETCKERSRSVSPMLPLEDEEEVHDCTCGEEPVDSCPAARGSILEPGLVHALHHGLIPGVNGTRAPAVPHRFAVRKIEDPDRPGLFASVVPLYKYSDYADDYCVKNMSRVPLCEHLPWTEFARNPPSPPPPPPPPSPRPYPVDDTPETTEEFKVEVKMEVDESESIGPNYDVKIEPEPVSLPRLEPSERLKAPLLTDEERPWSAKVESKVEMEVEECGGQLRPADHRTVERTRSVDVIDGAALRAATTAALDATPYSYSQTGAAVTIRAKEAALLPEESLQAALQVPDSDVDTLGRPPPPVRFAEWHECAKLGDLLALPYVVID